MLLNLKLTFRFNFSLILLKKENNYLYSFISIGDKMKTNCFLTEEEQIYFKLRLKRRLELIIIIKILINEIFFSRIP
jgi:hypothetical protein